MPENPATPSSPAPQPRVPPTKAFLTTSSGLSPARTDAPIPPAAPAITPGERPVAVAAAAAPPVATVRTASPTPMASLPIGVLAIFLTPSKTFFTPFTMALPAPLMALPTLFTCLLSQLNSGSPVTGLMVPEPPICLSIAASCGLM